MSVLTDWFAATIKPVYIGYYLTRAGARAGGMVLYWDGQWWRASEHSPSLHRFLFAPREWCGLVTPILEAA